MVKSSPKRSSLVQSAAVFAATLASLLLLGAVLAYWSWLWLAPSPPPRVRIAEQPAPRIDTAYGMFGGAQRSSTAVAAAPAVKLLGVVAAAGGASSYAVLQVEANKTLAVREGMEVAPGLRLAEVQTGQIALERNGVREIVVLPAKNSR